MSNKYKIVDQQGLHYLTLTTVGWIDLFTRQIYRDILIDSLKYCIANKGLSVHGYIIMPNHLHLIVSTRAPFLLSNVLRDFKAYTGRSIFQLLQDKKQIESRRDWLLHVCNYQALGRRDRQKYQLWQTDNHPIVLVSTKVILQKLNYIHQNPVRAGFVEQASDWLYSSAGFYETGKGLLSVEVLDCAYDLRQ